MEAEPRENSDLLSEAQRTIPRNDSRNTVRKEQVIGVPPDGGFRAYSVMVGSFLTNGLLFGVINSYSVIYTVLLHRLNSENVANAEARASLAGVLTMGTTFLLSPLSGVLTAFLGLRLTAVLGGAIAALGLLFSSFVVDNVDAFCFTYGIMYGVGASLAYTPSLAILGHYFKKYLGVVNGCVTIGSSIFTIFMPPLMEYMIKNYGLQWMFRLLSLLTVGIALSGLLFKPIPVVIIDKPLDESKGFIKLLRSIVNVNLWKNKKYRCWALSMPVALFGYFVPYIHIKKFIEDLKFKDVNFNLPLQCIGISSGIGRLVFGYLADRPSMDGILLQQVSFYVIGTLTIILPFVKSFNFLVAIALGMGLFDGAFIALIGPIAFKLCGAENAAQAIGYMLGLAAIPLSVGPPVAGKIYSCTNSYTLPFILAGISPLVGATLMFLIRFVKDDRFEKAKDLNGHAVTLSSIKRGKSFTLANGDA